MMCDVINGLEALAMILSAVGSVMTCQGGKADRDGNVCRCESRERRGDDEMMLGCLTAGALLQPHLTSFT